MSLGEAVVRSMLVGSKVVMVFVVTTEIPEPK
jgi:hypothetical protein